MGMKRRSNQSAVIVSLASACSEGPHHRIGQETLLTMLKVSLPDFKRKSAGAIELDCHSSRRHPSYSSAFAAPKTLDVSIGKRRVWSRSTTPQQLFLTVHDILYGMENKFLGGCDSL